MIQAISEIRLSRLCEFVAAQLGLHFPRNRWHDLERGIVSAAREFDFKDPNSCIDWLVASPLTKKQIEILASYLTVGETYFFREKRIFEILEEHILADLVRSRRETERCLRVWSAGCATGEEPYSVAILQSRMIPHLEDWNITVLATDINPGFLEKARRGVYSHWSFRDSPSWIREPYFGRSKDGQFALLPRIKKMVTFSYLNLAEDVYPSLLNNTNAMDIVFCRNVLMYFAPDIAKRVIQNFYRCLVDGGWLIVSPSETSHVLYSQFATVQFSGAILYRKESQRTTVVKELPCERVEEAKVSCQPPFHFAAEWRSEGNVNEAWKEPEPPQEVEEQTSAESNPCVFGDALRLFEQGCYAEAADQVLFLLSRNQSDAKAMVLLARIYANQGKLGEALAWCEKAIAADKLNAVSHYLRATILLEQGCLEEATVSLRRTLYLDPGFVLAHFALGNLALQEGELVKSEKHFNNMQSLLSAYQQEEILPESEGITAGRLMLIVSAYRDQRAGDRR